MKKKPHSHGWILAVLQDHGDTIREHIMACLAVYQWLEEQPGGPGVMRRLHLRQLCGFLLVAKSNYFLVTSGHALEGLRGRGESGALIYPATMIAGMKEDGRHCVLSFEGRTPKKRAWYDPLTGVDYGVIELTADEWGELTMAGAQFLTEENIADYGPQLILQEYDFCAIVGFPKATRTNLLAEDYEAITARYTPTLAALIPVEEKDLPTELQTHVRPWPRMFARIIPTKYVRSDQRSELMIKDWDGMSGAPCFGIKAAKNHLDFTALALQTSMLQKNGMLIGGYLRPLLSLLDA